MRRSKAPGEAPFELVYRHTRESHTAKHSLKSAQESGILHLDAEPGYHRYDFTELQDANYASTPVSFSVEHEVYSRPSVSFVRQHTRPICLDSTISGDAKIRMTGKAPWTIKLAVRAQASTRVSDYSVTSDEAEWTLDLPYQTTAIGRHEISIVGLSDASGCEWETHPQDQLSTVIEVVESARIVPVTQVQDVCVGDRLDFLLQGKAPWVIEYLWLGKKYRDTLSQTRFSRVADKAGNFEVKSVSLKDNQVSEAIHRYTRPRGQAVNPPGKVLVCVCLSEKTKEGMRAFERRKRVEGRGKGGREGRAGEMEGRERSGKGKEGRAAISPISPFFSSLARGDRCPVSQSRRR